MTERHEIVSMQDSLKVVIGELEYESCAHPGHGPEFVKSLLAAHENVSSAIKELEKAYNLLGGAP